MCRLLFRDSGYMPINDGHGTEIFFWFVESQDKPSTDPVVLWMNGGEMAPPNTFFRM